MAATPQSILTMLLAISLLTTCASAATDEEKMRNITAKAAESLGWDPPMKSEDAFGTGYVISADGLGDDSDIKGGASYVTTDIEAQMYLSYFEMWDMDRTGSRASSAKATNLTASQSTES